FDELLRRAAEAASAPDSAQLLETRYRARMVGDDLVGAATWSVRHGGPDPAFLLIDPLSIALKRCRWADNRPALLADFGRRGDRPLELLIDRPGTKSMTVDWSARGIADPIGTHYDLRVPRCAVATLELELPHGREPLVGREAALVTGPIVGETKDL